MEIALYKKNVLLLLLLLLLLLNLFSYKPPLLKIRDAKHSVDCYYKTVHQNNNKSLYSGGGGDT